MKVNALLMALIVSMPAIAAEVDAPPPVTKKKYTELYDKEAASKIVSRWSGRDRKPASNFSESDMSPSMRNIRDKVLTVKSAEQMDGLLNELESGYDKLAPDAKFFATQMLLLKPMRGLVWRMRPLFEKKKSKLDLFSGNKATHSAAVSGLRSLYHTTKIFVPTDQASAVFDYLVAPSKDMLKKDQFETVREYQAFLVKVMLEELNTANTRLQALLKTGQTPFVFDAKMLYGKGTFDDNLARFITFNDADVNLALASVEGAAHSILIFCAYNQDQLMNVAGDMGQLYGVDGFKSDALGVTSKERRDLLEGYRGKKFLEIKEKGYGQGLMSQALVRFQAHASYLKDAYDILAVAPANSQAFLNPMFFKADVQPSLAAGVKKMKELSLAPGSVRSPITGETVEIDIPGFYAKAPEQMLDLLPNDFVSVTEHEITVTNKAGEALKYRDYSEGRPTAWRNEEWKKLFPSLGGKQNVADAFRVIGYSNGPGALFGPMSQFIF